MAERKNVYTFVVMGVKTKEKRVVKGYKVNPSVYNKAMKQAKKKGHPLATTIEGWVSLYAQGYAVGLVSINPNSDK